jgi:hypothetical protein
MIIRYQEKSQEAELHPGPHHYYKCDDGYVEDTCECAFVSTVQATYDFMGSHRVRLNTDRHNTFRSEPIWMTPDEARHLASLLCFAANDAEQLNKDFPNE